MDTTCTRYCVTSTNISGAAWQLTFFSSSTKATHVSKDALFAKLARDALNSPSEALLPSSGKRKVSDSFLTLNDTGKKIRKHAHLSEKAEARCRQR
ncbi:unnamed protein product [Dovyalis caffra]|uniref:Uncharacterized protein n=1 Tax=Dovyalis caffra TaxID=77055 RepID=A0AAV1S0U9_9ROSI|nr:unnamed protein product [Dovyalis caffra]